jgi:hypothetical protein
MMDAIHAMEPELRYLQGVVTVLTILGEAQDSVEPIALSSLARSGRQALESLSNSWRIAFEGLRKP